MPNDSRSLMNMLVHIDAKSILHVKFFCTLLKILQTHQLVVPDSQVLVEKIVRLQRHIARKQEKLDFLEEHMATMTEEVKKKKRGRPPKKKPAEDTSSKISVSEMAENLSENQLCPITRDKIVFPLSSASTEEMKSERV